MRRYTSPDFLYIRSWLPCIFFAGVITMGNIGRQLALVGVGAGADLWNLDWSQLMPVLSLFQYEYKFIPEKSHQD